MATLNKVFLIGNLTRDPELRYVPSGTAVCSFSMAINRTFMLQSGEKREEVCFVRVVTWGKQAETVNQYLSKGSLVFVEGRLQYRAWEQEGQKRSTLEVKADRVQFLARTKQAEAIGPKETEFSEAVPEEPAAEYPETYEGKKADEEIPF
ncbi:MAG: single-stranded DNA-binding protein [Candidatus Omnitrophica bacterium]|nr:single-stranded DNA-binding protein [Candidatus Omnitrophota bacterium]